MFKADFDLTGGRLRRSATGRAGSVGHSSSTKRRQRYATSQRSGFNQTLGPGQPQLAGHGLGMQYSPVFDRAEIPDLGQQFLPADSQSQNKLFREIVTFDAIVGTAIEHWKDLAFSEQVILGGIEDAKVLQFYNDSIEASGIISMMPMLLHDFLVFGRFVFHMLMDESLGYWTSVIPHDLDYISIQVPPIPSMDPLIDLQPSEEQRQWATSRDPRVVEQRQTLDPALVKLMAAGQQIPLAPENTMFLPRRAFSTDKIGTSYLTRVLIFKVYESAIYNASVAAARRRAGPLMHIKAWENALDTEMDDLLDLFFASEEDPVGAKIVTKAGVDVEQIGGGSADYWKFSDEWPFLVEGKMRALGVSDVFMTGEANWNSMDTIRTIFVEKLQTLRSFFTRKIIIDKMFKQLARENKFVKRKTAELDHRYRIAKPRSLSDSDLIIPTAEWNRPLTPTKDQEYLDLLGRLKEEYGFPVPPRTVAQAAGFDIDKMMTGFRSDLVDRKRIYHFKRVLAGLQDKMHINPEGEYEAPEVPGEEEAPPFGFGEEEPFEFGEEEEFAFEEPAGEEAPEIEAPAPGGEEGFGADTRTKRFIVPPELKPSKGKQVVGSERTKPSQSYKVLGGKAVIDLLDTVPLWDEDDAVFGLPKKGVAKVLYEIAQSNPSHAARVRLSKKVYRKLRKDGYDDLQAQTVEYLAIRLGYLPVAPLTQDVYNILTRTVLNHMNGQGLTKNVTNELVALSRLASDQQAKPLTHKALSAMIKSPDDQLVPSRVLTGHIEPAKDLV